MGTDMPSTSPPQVAPGSPLSDLLGIMDRTEDAMLAVPPCNDNTDAYFAAAVQPHRQGAVELCDWLIAHGSHPELLSMGSATLQSTLSLEIKQLLPGLPPCTRAPAPALALPHFSSQSSVSLAKVSSDPATALRAGMNMDAQAPMTGNPDHDFAVQMSAHHWALIYMARVAMLHGKDQQLKDLASQLIVSLTWQTGEFRTILQNDYSTII
ncbi:g6052 [Coccomyxa viridis]|uniref:G6052 protein n=1 Tax=Coccomyxa viridis TaxID=1274662 RepID=A0ABP1FZI3_9CHLO